MKINDKQHITRRGVVKRNPPSENKIILLRLKNDDVFPHPEWRKIAHEKDEGRLNDEEIYFYAPNSLNFSKIKLGDSIELDEDFIVVGIKFNGNVSESPQGWTVLTNTNPGHNKFWSYRYNPDGTADVHWGKIGTQGESGVFPRDVVIKRQSEKLMKGYQIYGTGLSGYGAME